MATTIGDLLNDVMIGNRKNDELQKQRRDAEQALCDALELRHTPLKKGGSVVIGNNLVTRTEYGGISTKDIATIDLDSTAEFKSAPKECVNEVNE